MSRRGRGGGRGRGGRGGGNSQRIGGQEIHWDPELAIDKPQPSPTFPPYNPVKPQPLTTQEKKQVAHFLALRKRVHEGPYYTILGDNVRIGKAGNSAAAKFDPFEGMPTYSQKYTKNRRKLPDLSSRPYELKYFPKELHSTLDPNLALANGGDTVPPGKRPNISAAKRINHIKAMENRAGNERDEETELKEPIPDEDNPLEAEDVDDDFDEDDDEGGDYNAEGYFDDGGDDVGEDQDGGDGDGGDYF